jgi:hypothetical protein
MTNGQATAIGERVAVLETKLDAVIKSVDDLAGKQDQIIAGLAKIDQHQQTLQAAVEAMKPDVATISDIKRAGRLGAWVIGGIASAAALIATAKGWLVLNWQWLTGRL